MQINSLNLTNFRNYKKQKIEFSPSINVLVGDNGSGKTNILESIYTLALSRSYKAKDKDLVKVGEEFFKVSADISYERYDENLMMIGSQNGKKVFRNQAEIKKLSDFIGRINVVMFSPDDMLLFKNGPQEKRSLMDMSLLQLSKQYIEDYSAFKKQLKLRNDYLKYLLPKIKEEDDIKDDMLDVLTENFISLNEKIYEARVKFLNDLEKIAKDKYQELSGESHVINFKYETNFESNMEFFIKRYKSDVITGSTQNGCQRDDVKFYKDGLDFELSASQGEKRMLSLSIKLALADLINKQKSESPVILLDDVFSELDKNHQNRLLRMLDRKMQIIITSTDIIKIGKTALENARVYTINNSVIKENNING